MPNTIDSDVKMQNFNYPQNFKSDAEILLQAPHAHYK